MPLGSKRLHSVEVSCYRLHDGQREDQRFSKVVAASPAEAIAEAKMWLAPDESESRYQWQVAMSVELTPKEAREWLAWHSEAPGLAAAEEHRHVPDAAAERPARA